MAADMPESAIANEEPTAAVSEDRGESLMSELQTLKIAGLSDEEALNVLKMRRGEQAPTGDVHAQLEKDQFERERRQRIADHEAKLKDYEPPVTEETFTITIRKQDADWIRLVAQWESARRRGRVVTPEEAIALIVRGHRHEHPAMTVSIDPNKSSGPRAAFDPVTGGWRP